MNEALFMSIYHLSGQSTVLDNLMIYITNYALYLVYLIVIVLAVKRRQTEGKALIIIALTLVLASIIAKLLRVVIIEDRPYVTLDIQPLIQESWPKSFPSLHAMFSWIVAFGYWISGSKLTWLMVTIAIIISFSRIYLGVHYPFDILGGIILAGLSSLLAKYLLKRSGIF